MINAADIVITLGRDAQVEQVPGPQFDIWDSDEPSTRGFDGIERMRLIRDDITARVQHLDQELR